ncbi:MAG: hypothetical protein RSB99_02730 [Bacilli bacterium]
MVVKDMTFRKLDRKWFLLENSKDIKKINRLFHLKKSKYPILTFAYIDHEEGISLRILGPIEVVNKELFLNEKLISKRLDIIRYSEMENLELSLVPDAIIKKIKYTIDVIDEMNGYYTNKEVVKTRENVKLDNDRDLIMPDNIKFLALGEDKKREFLTGRIDGYDEETGYYIVSILEKPKLDFGIKVMDKVILKYVDRPNYQGLALVKKFCSEDIK